MEQGLVSVIVPAHNVQAYLVQCLDSILNQDYSNLELLLVENGSTDNTARICDEYAMKDPRIRVFHLEKADVSTARNTALDACCGEFISFIDSDDWVETNMMSSCVSLLADHHLAAVFFEGSIVREDGSTQGSVFHQFDVPTELPSRQVAVELLTDRIRNHICKAVFRRECWENIRFPVGRQFEDLSVLYQTMIDRDGSVLFLQDRFYYYRQNMQGITYGHNPRKIYDLFLAYYEHYRYACDHPELEATESCLANAANYGIGALHALIKYDACAPEYCQTILGFLKSEKQEILSCSGLDANRKAVICLFLLSPKLYIGLCRLWRTVRKMARLAKNNRLR